MQITFEFDPVGLDRYPDSFLAFAWHAAQHNPAPHGDYEAGELAEKIGREIIRRWLRGVEPEMYYHQGRDHYWSELRRFATYEPGGGAGTPEFHRGRWVPREPDAAEVSP